MKIKISKEVFLCQAKIIVNWFKNSQQAVFEYSSSGTSNFDTDYIAETTRNQIHLSPVTNE